MTRSRRGTRRSRSDRERGQRLPPSAAPLAVEPRCAASGKRRYASEDDALVTAYEYSQNNSFRLSSTAAYQCIFCGDYHLTSR